VIARPAGYILTGLHVRVATSITVSTGGSFSSRIKGRAKSRMTTGSITRTYRR